MNKTRPKNLDLLSISFPVTSISSILHRISGILLFFSIPLLLWALQTSLMSSRGFDEIVAMLSAPFAKFVAWALITAVVYHLIAGVRHLLMDAGLGESLEGGRLGAQLVLVLSVIAAVLIGVWLW